VTIIQANARHAEEPFGVAAGRYVLRPEPKVLRYLAYCCWERSNLLDDFEVATQADALLALSAHWRDWLRPLDAWEPPPGEAGAQFGSLARHLFARYELPRFLDSAWRAGLTAVGVTQQTWFKLIGAGRSIRTAAGLPLPLTRWMAHHFHQAPPDLDIPAAFRYGQVLGLGGDERLARSLLATRLGTDFHANDFWETVIRWLIEHPEVGPVQHGPIIDYLHHQKFVPSLPSDLRRGQPRLLVPRPHLCMKGRTPESLLRAVAHWHRQLGAGQLTFASWKPSGLPPFTAAETTATGRKVYAITELITSEELAEEGAALGHCVATYRALCETGQSSIWSLSVADASGRIDRLLTLEVRNWRRELVQARGQSNRVAQPDELRILRLWAQAGGLSLSSWLVP
jgi:hypothetical protein